MDDPQWAKSHQEWKKCDRWLPTLCNAAGVEHWCQRFDIKDQGYLLRVPWPQHTPSLTAHRPQPICVVAGNLVAWGQHTAWSLSSAQTSLFGQKQKEVTWTQDVSEPLKIRLLQRCKVSSGKSRISLARQFHLSRLLKENLVGGQCSTRNLRCIHNFCCPCNPLPPRHPHCGRHRPYLSLGFPHFLLDISLSRISCLFLCALQQGGITRVWGFKVRFSFVSSTPAPPAECGLGVCTVCTEYCKTRFQFWKIKSWRSWGVKNLCTNGVYMRPRCTFCLLLSGRLVWFGCFCCCCSRTGFLVLVPQNPNEAK